MNEPVSGMNVLPRQTRLLRFHGGSFLAKPKVYFYVQNLLGIGHVVRSVRIAEQLVRDGYDVLLITGGVPVPQLLKGSFEVFQLPALLVTDATFAELADETGRRASAQYLANRKRILLEVFEAGRPEIVIIETFPFGRRQMAFELLPLLEFLSQLSRRPLLLSSIRDVLQIQTELRKTIQTIKVINALFDGVLVHGDPAWIKLEDSFPMASEIADKIHYTGLVPPPSAISGSKIADIVVSAGGGAVGENLISSAIDAAWLLPRDLSWLIIPGPNSPQVLQAKARDIPSNCAISPFRSDFASILSQSEVSVSQAGYNTVCDVLQARCRAILVPFAQGHETEQALRAQRLMEMGVASVVSEQDLDGASLSAAITELLNTTRPRDLRIEMNGNSKTSLTIKNLYEAHMNSGTRPAPF